MKQKKKLSRRQKRNIAIAIPLGIILAILLICFVIIPLIKWLWSIFVWILAGIVFFVIICFALDT